MRKLSTVFILLFCISCARLHFTSSKDVSVKFREVEGHNKPINIKVKKDFYLWGLLPNSHTLDLGEQMAQKGMSSIAELKIEEVDADRNSFYSIISFGMYIPRTYVIKGMTSFEYDSPTDGDSD